MLPPSDELSAFSDQLSAFGGRDPTLVLIVLIVLQKISRFGGAGRICDGAKEARDVD
jgi:hypothetical protein